MQTHKKKQTSRSKIEANTVSAYLKSLKSPGKGSRQSPAVLKSRISKLKAQLKGATPVVQLSLHQKLIELENKLRASLKVSDSPNLEADFIKVGASFSRRKGITYKAWRRYGVPIKVLEKAGIKKA